MPSVIDKCLGSLLGGAVGDALGFAVEFNSYSSIVRRFGLPGICSYMLNSEGTALVSDDTQMTLFTADGIVKALAAGAPVTAEGFKPYIKQAYLDWLATQHFAYREGREGLMRHRELWSRRAPGITCLSALESLKAGMCVHNNSKGCGGVMRVAPFGLFVGAHAGLDIALAGVLAGMSAELTHLHKASTYASGACAAMIARIVREQKEVDADYFYELVRSVALEMVGECHSSAPAREVAELMLRALELSLGDCSDVEGIAQLGEGWVGDEALAIAIFCVHRHMDDFRACMIAAVNHDGDSDSTGAIAGNILGAVLGVSAIPEEYLAPLELRDLIEETARKLV